MIFGFAKRVPRPLLGIVLALTIIPTTGCSIFTSDEAPSVIGLKLGQAAQQLEEKGFDLETITVLSAPRGADFNDGWTVCNQSPKEGEALDSDKTLKLLVGEDCSVVNNDGTIKGQSAPAKTAAPAIVPPAPVIEPAPVPEPVPEPEPEPEPVQPEPVIQEPAAEPAGDVDPDMGSCKEARAAGYGPYSKGQPEYEYYQDRDGDGEVCEDN